MAALGSVIGSAAGLGGVRCGFRRTVLLARPGLGFGWWSWAWTAGQLLGSTVLGAIFGGWRVVLGPGRDLGSGLGRGLWACWGRWCRVRPSVADVRCQVGVGIWALVLGVDGGSTAGLHGVGCGFQRLVCPSAELA